MGKRADKKAATRRLLKQAALKLFEKRSVALARPVDVTQAAGVAQGTFYVHFANHAELVDELVADLNTQLNSALLGALASAKPKKLRDAGVVLAEALLDFYQPRLGVFGIFTDHATRHGPNMLVGSNTAIIQAIMQALAGYGKHELSPFEADFLGHSVVALWRQFVLRGVRDGETRKQVIAALMRATEAMLTEFLPGVFNIDTAILVQAMLAAAQSQASPAQVE